MQLRRGQLAAIEFLDHVANASRPLKFVVYGRVASVTRSSITIDSWAYVDKKQTHDANVNRHTLVRAAVTKVSILRPDKNAST